MSRSYRDRPKRITAVVKFPRDKAGRFIFPKVIRRKCRKGDRYPFETRHVKALIRSVPKEYVYGLKLIELKDRKGKLIGRPYGVYWPDEKRVILYSVPSGKWVFENLGDGWKSMFRSLGAKIQDKKAPIEVVWEKESDVAFFSFMVLLHELGHHHDHQYPTKKARPSRESDGEYMADQHSFRLAEKDLFKKTWGVIESVFEKGDVLKLKDADPELAESLRLLFSEWR